MKTWHWTLIILACVAVLIVVPFVVSGDSEFAGADGQAEGVITAVNPGYEPWFTPLWKPAGETETMLFSLQTAIGAGLLAFSFGYWVGRLRGRKEGAHGTAGRGTQTNARLAATPGDL
jgi:cobalt/nickel transport protein